MPINGTKESNEKNTPRVRGQYLDTGATCATWGMETGPQPARDGPNRQESWDTM